MVDEASTLALTPLLGRARADPEMSVCTGVAREKMTDYMCEPASVC